MTLAELIQLKLPLVIALPLALLIFQKTELYRCLKKLLTYIYNLAGRLCCKCINSVKNDLSYRNPSKKQQRPIKEANKTVGWTVICIFSLFTAWIMIYGTSVLALSALKENPTVFSFGILFFALCILLATWLTACAHKAAWQNGIGITLKRN